MKQLADAIKTIENHYGNLFVRTQQNKRPPKCIPYSDRDKHDLPCDAQTAGVPFDTMYFFNDAATPYRKEPHVYLPRPGKSFTLGFEYKTVEAPLVTAAVVRVNSEHIKDIKSSVAIPVSDMKYRFKALIEHLKKFEALTVDIFLELFEQHVIVEDVTKTNVGLEEIKKIESELKVELRRFIETESLMKTAKYKADKSLSKAREVASFDATLVGLEREISALKKQLESLQMKKRHRLSEIDDQYHVGGYSNRFKELKNTNQNLEYTLRDKLRQALTKLPLSLKEVVRSYFASKLKIHL